MVNLGTSNATAPAAAPKFEHVTWYKEPHLRRLYFLSFFLLIGSATTGFDGMLQNTSQQMDYWKSYFPEYNDPNKLGILINMYNIGSIIAYFISPYIVDTSGRRPAIMAGCFFMIAGACLTASAQNFGSKFMPSRRFINGFYIYTKVVFIGGRFVLGFCNALSQISSPMLLTEICHPQHRGPLTTVYNCLFSVGALWKKHTRLQLGYLQTANGTQLSPWSAGVSHLYLATGLGAPLPSCNAFHPSFKSQASGGYQSLRVCSFIGIVPRRPSPCW